MRGISVTIEETMKLLVDAGFTSGWALLGGQLSLWEHEQDPPSPLQRPTEEHLTELSEAKDEATPPH
jgi:hypothetical protein